MTQTKKTLEERIEEAIEFTKKEKAKAAGYAKLSYSEKIARKRGFECNIEYRNWLAQEKGFKNVAEYEQKQQFKRGIGTGLSMGENINSAVYLGIYVAERLLPKIFDNPKAMPYGNTGYDYICKNGYKIDVKSSSLRKANYWKFDIRKNKIADVFLCIAFDNRLNLNVKHIWLIPGNEIIRTQKLNELISLCISDCDYSKDPLKKYELTDKLTEANNACNRFRSGDLK